MSTPKQKPCTITPKHKWAWMHNTKQGSMTITARGSFGRLTLKGVYHCACGARRNGLPNSNGTDLRGVLGMPEKVGAA